ncbi:NAD(P)H-dependent glycerol-3-phosphate dehydrogenase [Flavihumibacter sp. ZG627]|uniref:NAD(P)H-dependent glycerol-3-phosphate dehydrogenase n=1 Tax=Flavihumibacter sp. ZG627 TaxID=1463156 RepID=UPI0005801D39|nr:NAD(P)H-dependent glycerol-3-phosphate dehydrogenase [Flavihumibacter sp. ZG627]KIC90918.1 hypothetical protein HY58_07740 [Flavihumibacter sp. ZG627]
MPHKKRITIIGSGSWATALVKIFSESGFYVTWQLRSQENVDFILGHGRPPHYLSYVQLELERINPVTDLMEALEASDNILFAVPSAFLESTISVWEGEFPKHKQLLVSIKGVVPSTGDFPSVYLARRFQLSVSEIIVLGGPCHAEEIAMGRRTFLTISGRNDKAVSELAAEITCHYLRVITNPDPMGVELAAIMKNVVGIAAGLVRGMNYGDNFLAVVISNAMRETNMLLDALDPGNRDLNDSAYFGDLLVTAYSPFSRNGNFGQLIGRGYSVTMAKAQMQMTAEGYPAAEGLYRQAIGAGLQLPLLSAVYRILYKQAAPFNEIKLLEHYLR